MNAAGLTVLFYKYIEERDLLTALSRETFREHRFSRKISVSVFSGVLVFFSVTLLALANKYAYLQEDVKLPMVCAHRGDNVHAPENTMPAFELAASENLPWIELDVYLPSDGVLICSHDASLKRVTGQDLTIHDHTYAELTACEMGDWMPGRYEHVVVPKLSDVLDMAREEGLQVQVELKGDPEDIGFEENILQVIEDAGMHDQVMIIAQDYKRMERIKELDPTITKGYCMFAAFGNLVDIPYTDNISIEENNVTPELVGQMHEQGRKVFCWTVDLDDTVQYLVSCGVDVIGTDNPMLVTAALEKANTSGGITRIFHILMHSIANMDK